MININVSLFDGFKNPKPVKSVSLLEYLLSENHRQYVEYIRTLTDKDEIRKWKSKLPCITVSGEFESRNANKLISHSGYICIDIDGNDNPTILDFKELRDMLKKIKNIAFVSLSVSGKGVFCIIPIEDSSSHKEHFEALKNIFKTLGIIIDKGCGDVSRLRCCSYDEGAYYNENAILFTQKNDVNKSTQKLKTYNLKENKERGINLSKPNYKSNYDKVLSKIRELIKNKIDITKNYTDWFNVGSAFANEFGEEGRELFHLISQPNERYHESQTDSKFSSVLQTSYSINIGTFFHLANKALKK